MDKASWAVAILACILYYNTLDAGFVYDDSRAVVGNPDVAAGAPPLRLLRCDFWGSPLAWTGSHGSYRPLTVLTFRLNRWLAGGFRPAAFHAVNVALHATASALVLKLARLLGLASAPAAAAGAIFAAHPVHCEAVAGIVGRADLLACVLALGSILSYARFVSERDKDSNEYSKKSASTALGVRALAPLVVSLVAASAAMLAKETGVTVLGVCAVYDLALQLRSRRLRGQAWRPFGPAVLWVVATALLLIRLRGLPTPPSSHAAPFAAADNPAARSPDRLTRTLTFLYLPAFNFAHLFVLPQRLSFDWSMDAIPRVTTLSDVRNAASLLLYAALCRIVAGTIKSLGACEIEKRRRRTSSASGRSGRSSPICAPPTPLLYQLPRVPLPPPEVPLVASALVAFPFLPASNLFFYVGFVAAERVLYLPSVGYCLLVSAGLQRVFSAIGTCRSARHNRRLCPRHRLAITAITAGLVIFLAALAARTLTRNRDWRDEESLYRSGIAVNPPKAYGNLGSVLSAQGRLEEAERAFRLALTFRPNMADVHYNLGLLLQARGQQEGAARSYLRAIHYRPSLALAHLQLGQLLARHGRCTEAAQVLARCAQLSATGVRDRRAHQAARVSALLLLGNLHAEQGRGQRALAAYRRALELRPPRYPPQMLYGLLADALSRLRETGEAARWYQAAQQARARTGAGAGAWDLEPDDDDDVELDDNDDTWYREETAAQADIAAQASGTARSATTVTSTPPEQAPPSPSALRWLHSERNRSGVAFVTASVTSNRSRGGR